MISSSLVWLCAGILGASARASLLPRADTNASSVAFVDPTTNGGTWLTDAGNGLGEPINVVISGLSDPRVLTDYYFPYFYHSIGFSGNCLGAIAESQQQANIGDGKGEINETSVIRWNYGDVNFGSCKETINGGNHFRYWQQSGSTANTNAIFMAVSYEQPLSQGHTISPNGYNNGRDQLVGNATVSGGTSFRNVSFYTTSQVLTGYLPSGSKGINHGISIDGDVYLLTVNITEIAGNAASAAPSLLYVGTVHWDSLIRQAIHLYQQSVAISSMHLGIPLSYFHISKAQALDNTDVIAY